MIVDQPALGCRSPYSQAKALNRSNGLKNLGNKLSRSEGGLGIGVSKIQAQGYASLITSPPAARMVWTCERIVLPLGSVSFATVAPTPQLNKFRSRIAEHNLVETTAIYTYVLTDLRELARLPRSSDRPRPGVYLNPRLKLLPHELECEVRAHADPY